MGNEEHTPPAVHDIDEDGSVELLFGITGSFQGYDIAVDSAGELSWSVPVDDSSGMASGTAFDFLGDGSAEAMYADESFLYGFDPTGDVVFQAAHISPTQIEYPIVADVDDDGSAEILLVSGNILNYGPNDTFGYPTLQVFRDADDRWIQARRIWNQHTYHVTNVREDGTIPMVEPKHWQNQNTFRTNSQIEDGGVCVPPVG